jgi:2-haloacid dehalogenase
VAEPMFQANEVQTDHALRLPVLLVFDVNETLSNMAPLSARFEEVGASGQLAGAWFAGDS